MSLDDNNLVPDGAEDKTLKNEDEDDPLKDFPDEDEKFDDKEKKVEKSKSSEIAQKIKYREKYREAKNKIRDLEEKLKTTAPAKAPADEDDKEKAAREYIRRQAREELEQLRKEEKEKEDAAVEKFDDEVESVLEENPNLTEEKIVETCEEFKVSPTTAAKMLNKFNTETKVKKPKLPEPKRGTGEVEEKKKDDSKKSMWDIANDIKRGLKSKKE